MSGETYAADEQYVERYGIWLFEPGALSQGRGATGFTCRHLSLFGRSLRVLVREGMSEEQVNDEAWRLLLSDRARETYERQTHTQRSGA